MILFGVVLACAGSKSDAPPRGESASSNRDSGSRSAVTATPPDSNPAGERKVLFLGTSLTAGLGLEPDSAYPQQVQRKIDSAGMAFQVVNAGVSGETSAGLLQRLDWVLRQPAAVIVVETGANDGLRGQSVETTKATIGQVLDRIKHDKPDAKVLLVQMEAPTNMGTGYTRPFHAMFPALAREKGVALLPFLLDGVAGKAELNQADGIHPNYRGEAIVAGNVWRGLREILSKL